MKPRLETQNVYHFSDDLCWSRAKVNKFIKCFSLNGEDVSLTYFYSKPFLSHLTGHVSAIFIFEGVGNSEQK